MNREVHVRFWERPEVKVLRATRQSRHFPSPTTVYAWMDTMSVRIDANSLRVFGLYSEVRICDFPGVPAS
jgi:hypothetical protein